MQTHFCDFECTVAPAGSRARDKSRLETGVWLWQSRDEDGEHEATGYDMTTFMEWVLTSQPGNYVFHNLRGYDGHFVFAWLLDHGYHHYRPERMVDETHTMKMLWKQNEAADYFEGDTGCFTVFTGGQPSATFYDSMPLMNTSLRSVGKALDMPGIGKGDETPLVVHGTRLEDTQHRGHDDGRGNGTYWTWAEALAYMEQDTLVLAAGAKRFGLCAALENGIHTQSKLAYETVYARLDTENRNGEQVTNRTNLGNNGRLTLDRSTDYAPAHPGYPVGVLTSKGKFNGYKYRPTVKPFTQRRIPTPEQYTTFAKYQDTMTAVNTIVKRSYRGGLCWVNPVWQDHHITDTITVLDINSMYPAIYMDTALPREVAPSGMTPYPEGLVLDADGLRELVADKLLVVRFSHLTARVRDGWPPTIKPRTDAGETAEVWSTLDTSKSVNEVYDPVIDWPVTLTNEDVEYLCEAYDVERAVVRMTIEFERSGELETMYREHGQHWMHVKETATGYDRVYSKIMVNAPYGKLGQFTREYPVYDYTVDDYERLVDHNVGGRKNAEVMAAALITARGRRFLAESMHRVGLHRVAYCDTDSMHIVGEVTDGWLREVGITVHDTKAGAWKIENRATEGLFIQPKTYGEMVLDTNTGETVWKTTTAGLTQQVPQAEFRRGMKIVDRRSTKVKGGVVILDTPMVIAEHNPKVMDVDTMKQLALPTR